jgi:hypothetical protein
MENELEEARKEIERLRLRLEFLMCCLDIEDEKQFKYYMQGYLNLRGPKWKTVDALAQEFSRLRKARKSTEDNP